MAVAPLLIPPIVVQDDSPLCSEVLLYLPEHRAVDSPDDNLRFELPSDDTESMVEVGMPATFGSFTPTESPELLDRLLVGELNSGPLEDVHNGDRPTAESISLLYIPWFGHNV